MDSIRSSAPFWIGLLLVLCGGLVLGGGASAHGGGVHGANLYSEAPAPSSAPLSLDRRERAQGPTRATDHNLFIRGDYVYLANDAAGFRILELVNPATADLEEIAYFDIYPRRDWSGLRGAWTAYPYFDSGIVSISGMEQGLFIVRPDLPGGS